MKLESERLIFSDTLVSDTPFYFELFNDPDWIKFISDKKLKSVEETKMCLKDFLLKNFQAGGLGFLLLF